MAVRLPAQLAQAAKSTNNTRRSRRAQKGDGKRGSKRSVYEYKKIITFAAVGNKRGFPALAFRRQRAHLVAGPHHDWGQRALQVDT